MLVKERYVVVLASVTERFPMVTTSQYLPELLLEALLDSWCWLCSQQK